MENGVIFVLIFVSLFHFDIVINQTENRWLYDLTIKKGPLFHCIYLWCTVTNRCSANNCIFESKKRMKSNTDTSNPHRYRHSIDAWHTNIYAITTIHRMQPKSLMVNVWSSSMQFHQFCLVSLSQGGLCNASSTVQIKRSKLGEEIPNGFVFFFLVRSTRTMPLYFYLWTNNIVYAEIVKDLIDFCKSCSIVLNNFSDKKMCWLLFDERNWIDWRFVGKS